MLPTDVVFLPVNVIHWPGVDNGIQSRPIRWHRIVWRSRHSERCFRFNRDSDRGGGIVQELVECVVSKCNVLWCACVGGAGSSYLWHENQNERADQGLPNQNRKTSHRAYIFKFAQANSFWLSCNFDPKSANYIPSLLRPEWLPFGPAVSAHCGRLAQTHISLIFFARTFLEQNCVLIPAGRSRAVRAKAKKSLSGSRKTARSRAACPRIEVRGHGGAAPLVAIEIVRAGYSHAPPEAFRNC